MRNSARSPAVEASDENVVEVAPPSADQPAPGESEPASIERIGLVPDSDTVPRETESSAKFAVLPVQSISVGPRVRRERAVPQSLLDSMKTEGQLQPIGVRRNENVSEKYELVFGAFRLAAAKQLGWHSINATILESTKDSYKLEVDENMARSSFTLAERVAIAARVLEELKDRKKNPQDFAEFQGTESIEIAAKRSGFGNKESLRQARKVVENGCPELVAALTARHIAIHEAAELAKLPHHEQLVRLHVEEQSTDENATSEIEGRKKELKKSQKLNLDVSSYHSLAEQFGAKEDRQCMLARLTSSDATTLKAFVARAASHLKKEGVDKVEVIVMGESTDSEEEAAPVKRKVSGDK